MCHMDVPTVRLLYEIGLIEHLLPFVPTPMLPNLMSEVLALFIYSNYFNATTCQFVLVRVHQVFA